MIHGGDRQPRYVFRKRGHTLMQQSPPARSKCIIYTAGEINVPQYALLEAIQPYTYPLAKNKAVFSPDRIVASVLKFLNNKFSFVLKYGNCFRIVAAWPLHIFDRHV